LGWALQYAVAALGFLILALIEYAVGRPRVLLVPWAVTAAWLVVGVIVEVAHRSDEWGEFDGVVFLLVYAFWADVLLAGGLAVALIRDRRRWRRSRAGSH
jgi:predicted Na+-dependent transporter